jgi:DNA-binding NarL/FixJ family response regulator
MIRIVICDDQVVVSEGLKAILTSSDAAQDIDVVGVAYDGEQAVELVEKLRPDVILMDLKMPIKNGIQATREIRDRFPGTRVLVLTTYDFDEWVFDAIRNGAAGYLLKDTPRDALITAIRGTAEGKTYVDPAIAGKLFQQITRTVPHTTDMPAGGEKSLKKILSERELDILRLLAHGLSNADIAAQLYLSEGTVRNYVSTIINKMGVTDRTQAAVQALRDGIF